MLKENQLVLRCTAAPAAFAFLKLFRQYFDDRSKLRRVIFTHHFGHQFVKAVQAALLFFLL